jgi:hypothetical protein
MNPALFIFLQVLVALIVVLILYMITLVVINTDALVIDADDRVKQNEETKIITGFANVSKLAGRSYNTINPFADNFKKIAKSLNDRGGAQFTYQFWMKVEDTDPLNYKDLIILMKGDNRKFNRSLYNPGNKQKTSGDDFSGEYTIGCPIIKFGDSYKQMVVEFNTNNNPKASMIVNADGSLNPLFKRNILSLSPANWYMITFVFEDNFSFASGSENGIKVTLYINDFAYQVASASTDPLLRNNTLKQNDGNLFLFPNVSQAKDFMKIGNINYYNYAMSHSDVENSFAKGPPKFEFVESDPTNSSKPAFLTAYNSLDIYNM